MWLQAGLLVSNPLILLLLQLSCIPLSPPFPFCTLTDDVVVTASVVVDFGKFIDV